MNWSAGVTPGNQSPNDGTDQPGKDHQVIHLVQVDQLAADGMRYAVPKVNAATKLKTAAQSPLQRRQHPVETTVAIELAAS